MRFFYWSGIWWEVLKFYLSISAPQIWWSAEGGGEPSGSSSSIILFISSSSCCLLADTLATGFEVAASVLIAGSATADAVSVFVSGSSSFFRAGGGLFGGALAKADMIFPEAVRFIVVVDFVGSDVLLLDTHRYETDFFSAATGFAAGGGGSLVICFGMGLFVDLDAAVPTTTAGGTYFVNCRFYRQ